MVLPSPLPCARRVEERAAASSVLHSAVRLALSPKSLAASPALLPEGRLEHPDGPPDPHQQRCEARGAQNREEGVGGLRLQPAAGPDAEGALGAPAREQGGLGQAPELELH